jgi:hypothetical protein
MKCTFAPLPAAAVAVVAAAAVAAAAVVIKPIICWLPAGFGGVKKRGEPRREGLMTKVKRVEARLWFTALAVGWFSIGALAQSPVLSPPWQQQAMGGITPQRTIPKIEHGYLLQFMPHVKDGPAAGMIHWNSLATQRQGDLSFWLPGASEIWLNDVGATPDGNILVAGTYAESGQNSVNNFLAWVDPAGTILQTVNPGSYEPERVCATNDGNIWTLGQDWGAQADYNMVRKNSSSGEVLGSFLSRLSFPRVSFDLGTYTHSQPAHPVQTPPGRTYLVCGNASVGAYVGPALTWFEISLMDGSSQRFHVPPPAPFSWITGIALRQPHEVYASFDTRIQSESVGPSLRQRGLYALSVRGQAANWEPFDGSVGPAEAAGGFARLDGRDGPNLVYARNKTVSADGSPVLFWSAR